MRVFVLTTDPVIDVAAAESKRFGAVTSGARGRPISGCEVRR